MNDNHRRIFRPLNDRWFYQKIQKIILLEWYQDGHAHDDRVVGWTWKRMLKETVKIDGVIYRGRDGELRARVS